MASGERQHSKGRQGIRRLARWGLSLALAAALLGTVVPRPAQAAALVVDRADDVAGLLCTGALSDCSLRSAVNIANTNGVSDVITFSANFTITLGSTLSLTATGTTIQATAGQVVEINANGTGQAFYITASDTTLDGLRIYGSAVGTTNVWIAGSAQRVRIANAIIGDDDLGFLGTCGNSPNSHSGIYITSNANPGGGDALAWIYGTDIKCIDGSPGHGIEIAGSREVVIGADSAGNAGSAQNNFVMLNAGDAVHLSPGSDSNTIRNSFLQYSDNGLVIDGSDSNWVYGNHMQANDLHGVHLSGGSRLNTIGCALLAGDPSNTSLRNVIHGNNMHGIFISGTGTDINMILCNWIGLDDPGTGAYGNNQHGVFIDNGAEDNIIGAGSTTRNVISGNGRSGIIIVGSGTRGNLVQGNFIGLNATGTAAVGNEWDGVTIGDGATQNTVGGTSPTTLNVIAGNLNYGIYIYGSTTASNTVKYNDIGLSTLAGNAPLPNLWDGLRLGSGTQGNIIGGPGGSLNFIAHNGENGVTVADGAYNNTFADNRVFSNTLSGVVLDGVGTTGNIFSQFHSYGNGQDGIAERNSATGNRWQVISIYNNGGLGIDKATSGATTDTPTAPYPVITSVNVGTGLVQGTASASALVELYRAAPDPLGFGEGKTFLGSTTANGAGAWSLNVGPGLVNCYTAFQTVGGASSEFGPHTCPTVRLPAVLR